MVCPLCQSAKIKFNISEVDSIWKTTKNVNFCTNCECYFLHEMPTSIELKQHYSEIYYETLSRMAEIVKYFFRRARVQSQFDFIRKNLRVGKSPSCLEVGAGDAMLSYEFKKMEFEVTALEMSSHYRHFAERKFGIVLKPEDFFQLVESYHVIAMSHVFEHFIDLKSVLRQINDRLKPSGIVFLEVPESPRVSEISSKELKEYLNTTHTYNFSQNGLTDFLKKNGFEILAEERVRYRKIPLMSMNGYLKISKSLLTGNLSGWVTIFQFFFYLLLVVLFPKKFYEPVTEKTKWNGWGDNLRLIIRPIKR